MLLLNRPEKGGTCTTRKGRAFYKPKGAGLLQPERGGPSTTRKGTGYLHPEKVRSWLSAPCLVLAGLMWIIVYPALTSGEI